MNRWDIINLLIEKNNYRTYLEIGYFKGWSFDNVRCYLKVAVDPNPSKTVAQQELPYGGHMPSNPTDPWLLEKMTSDEFFNIIHATTLFDIIFIDGLHEASQVEKDIRNSLDHLSPKGTIVLHDCNPPTLAHATTGDAAGNWNGDVYKAFIKFRLQYPEYETYTVNTDWGCGIIYTPPKEGMYIDLTTEEVESLLQWDNFDVNRMNLLNLISVEEFINKTNERAKSTDMPA